MNETELLFKLIQNPTVGAVVIFILFITYKLIQFLIHWADSKANEIVAERDKRLQEHRDFTNRIEQMLERTIVALENNNRIISASADGIEQLIENLDNNEILRDILSAVSKDTR